MTDNPKRRWLQFSLRTLFVVVTVFCVWMGIAAKRARDQRLAVEAIEEVSGQVFYKHQWPQNFRSDPPGPEWLREIIGDEYFFSVYFLNFGNPWVTDAALEHLRGFRRTNLVRLNLSNIKLSGAGLEHVKELTSLRVLNLNTTKITDADLEYLRGLTKLQQLYLSNTQVTDEGVKKLQQTLPNCMIRR